MQTTDVVKSSVLLILGAAASAVGFEIGRNAEPREMTLSPEQIHTIVARIGSLEDRLIASLESGHPPVEIDARPPVVTRSKEVEGDTVRLLSEIRDDLKILVHGVGREGNPTAGDVSDGTKALAKTAQLDGADAKKIMKRHFCQTFSQVYATYGMPDMKDGGMGSQYWRYHVDGVGWIIFHFVDGVVFEVTINPP